MGKSNKSSSMREFCFDIVINQLVFNESGVDNSLVAVTVNFRDIDHEITSSRINVTDFREGRSFEFEDEPEVLRNAMAEKPLKLTVKNGEEIFGEVNIDWPAKLIADLEKENFSTFSHAEEAAILDPAKEKIGSLIVTLKLQVKCSADILPRHGPLSTDKSGNLPICAEIERVIDPNDVLFVIGDSPAENYGQNVLTQCGNETCPVSLDLAKYQIVRGKLVKSPEILNTCGNLDCCELKSGAEDYNAMVESLCKQLKRQPSQKDSECCAQTRNKRRTTRSQRNKENFACQADRHVHECPHSDKFTDSDTEAESLADGFRPRNKCRNMCQSQSQDTVCPYPSTPPILKGSGVIRPKICPICQKDISWLPKFAACPKCGYKPVPYKVEENYNDKLTAEQILSEWTESNRTSYRQSSSVKLPSSESCRCKCRNGKICAYCRIKRICSDLYRGRRSSEPKNTGSRANIARNPEPDPYEQCPEEENPDDRPYLSRVLSELKDLYNINPKKKPKSKKLTKHEQMCENMLHERPSKRKKPKSYKIAPAPKIMSVDGHSSSGQVSQEKGASRDNRRGEKRGSSRERPPSRGRDKLKQATSACKDRYTRKIRQGIRRSICGPSNRIPAVGHKECTGEGLCVPRNMGWLWNIKADQRPGWKPGAIGKKIKEIMKYFLKDYPADTLQNSKYAYRKKEKEQTDCEDAVQKPTLHVKKKDGDYLITMRPLKDAEALKECQDPYLKAKPIQFRITKNPIELHRRELKKDLKKQGFTKCCCHNPIACCYCRPFLEKQHLEFQLKKLCCCRNIPNLKDTLVLSDTTDSDSELDIEFTPPAGLQKPALKKKPDQRCCETQYSEEDWNFKPVFMKPPNKFMRPFDCAMRFGRVEGFDRELIPNNGVRSGGPPPPVVVGQGAMGRAMIGGGFGPAARAGRFGPGLRQQGGPAGFGRGGFGGPAGRGGGGHQGLGVRGGPGGFGPSGRGGGGHQGVGVRGVGGGPAGRGMRGGPGGFHGPGGGRGGPGGFQGPGGYRGGPGGGFQGPGGYRGGPGGNRGGGGGPGGARAVGGKSGRGGKFVAAATRKTAKPEATMPPPLLCRIDRRRKPPPEWRCPCPYPCGPVDPCCAPCEASCYQNNCGYYCPVC